MCYWSVLALSALSTICAAAVTDVKLREMPFQFERANKNIGAVALSPNASLFAAGAQDGTLVLWKTADGRLMTAPFQVTSERITALGFDSSGQRIAVASAKEVKIVDVASRAVTTVAGEWNDVAAIDLSGSTLAWSAADRKVHVRALGSDRAETTLEGNAGRVTAVTFTPDGTQLAAGEEFRYARLWSLNTGCEQQAIVNSSSLPVEISFTRDGRRMAVVTASGIQIADPASGAELLRFRPEAGEFRSAAFAPDGTLTAISYDERLRLWRSDPLGLPARRPGRPVLHILTAGIDQYPRSNMRLEFAGRDARELDTFFHQYADRLSYEPRSMRLTGTCATAARINSVLDEIRVTAKPQDAVLVFLAGHGGSHNKEFYFYPFDVNLKNADATAGSALSGSALARSLAQIPAARQLVVVDACRSGSALAAFRRALLAQSRSRRSVQLLASAGADQEAMEVATLGHGITTHVLLQSLHAHANAVAGQSARSLFQETATTVPVVAARYHKKGAQRPEYSSVGEDFELIAPAAEVQKVAAVSVADIPSNQAPQARPTFGCRPVAADPTLVRAEGRTELVGDLVMRCEGPASSSPRTLVVAINTAIAGTSLMSGDTEAILVFEEPGTRLPDSAIQLGRNAFAATIGPKENMIAWQSVPFPVKAGTGRVDTQVRVTRLRADVSAIGRAAGSGQASRIVGAWQFLDAKTPEASYPLAFVSGALKATFGTCEGAARHVVFDSSEGENEALAGSGVEGNMQISVRFSEHFVDHFSGEPRERGAAVAGTREPTRLALRIRNLPAGVRLFATTRAIPEGTTPGALAVLTRTDANGRGSFDPVPPSAAGVCGTGGSYEVAQLAPVTDAQGKETGVWQAVWEVTSADAQQLDTLAFGLMVAYQSRPDANRPGLGTAVATVTYAPVSSSIAQRRQIAPSFSEAFQFQNLFSVYPPVSVLAFPDVTNEAGYDTGMTIRNIGPGSGRCALHYNGRLVTGRAHAEMEFTDQDVAPGQEIRLRLSEGGNLGLRGSPGFRGCLVAQCYFKRVEGSRVLYDQPDRHGPPSPGVVLKPGQTPESVDPQCVFVQRR